MKNNKAGFRLRFLASIIDLTVLVLPHALFWLYLSSSRDISDLGSKLALYLIVWLLPSTALGFLHSSLLTYYFGGTIGKLATGLCVIGENNQKLSLKRIIFRQTVGYSFSFTLFGLGYLSVIKDQNKQAWHDKAVSSQVLKTRTLWPLGLTVFLLLAWFNFFLISSTVNSFSRGRLPNDFSEVFESVTKEKPVPTLTPSPANNIRRL